MKVSNPFQCLTLFLLILPPLLLTTYFFAAFPNPPEPLPIHPSLTSLPKTSNSWTIYPEDYFPDGAYVSFPYGRVRYWLLGPQDGTKLVLIHGLSVPSIIWKDVAPELTSRGYRVLLYDLYGRGYSDAPQTTYDSALYATQLALLMQHIKWDRSLIAGVSMGGGIAAAFTAHFPHLVADRVALIACAGLIETTDLSRTTKFMSSPLVQTLTSSLPVRKYLQHLANSSNPTSLEPNPIQEIVRIQSAHLPGYNAALSSSLRDGPVRGLASSFASPAFAHKQVLLIHGTHDKTVPYKYSARIQALLPPSAQSRLITIDGGSHDLLVSHSELVGDALVRFFNGGGGTGAWG